MKSPRPPKATVANRAPPAGGGPTRAVSARVPAEAEPDGDEHGGLEDLDQHDGGDLGAQQAGPAQRRRAEALEDAVAALESGGDAQRDHRRRHHGQGQDPGHEEVDGLLVRRGDHVHGGEEDEEDDRDAHRQQQGLTAPQGHEHLGPGLGHERPHAPPPAAAVDAGLPAAPCARGGWCRCGEFQGRRAHRFEVDLLERAPGHQVGQRGVAGRQPGGQRGRGLRARHPLDPVATRCASSLTPCPGPERRGQRGRVEPRGSAEDEPDRSRGRGQTRRASLRGPPGPRTG